MTEIPQWIYMALATLCSFMVIVGVIIGFHLGYNVARDHFGGDS